MLDFYKTAAGKHFFEGRIPKIVSALEAIAKELKRANDNEAAAAQPVAPAPECRCPKCGGGLIIEADIMVSQGDELHHRCRCYECGVTGTAVFSFSVVRPDVTSE